MTGKQGSCKTKTISQRTTDYRLTPPTFFLARSNRGGERGIYDPDFFADTDDVSVLLTGSWHLTIPFLRTQRKTECPCNTQTLFLENLRVLTEMGLFVGVYMLGKLPNTLDKLFFLFMREG